MAETLIIDPNLEKKERYLALIPQIKALVEFESDPIANQANFVAALKQAFNFFWVGFYWVKSDVLVLGPFQGPIACTRIAYGKGVCGTAWSTATPQLVPDVDAFPGHIACSSESKSELVLPIVLNNKVVGVLDVDSDKLADFDSIDLEMFNNLLEVCLNFLVHE